MRVASTAISCTASQRESGWSFRSWRMSRDYSENPAPETANSDNPMAAELAVLDALRAVAPKILPYAEPCWRILDEARRAELHAPNGARVIATYHPSAAISFGPAGMPRAALREDLALVASLVAGRAGTEAT